MKYLTGRAAIQVDAVSANRIRGIRFKGAKPAALPVDELSQIVLTVNLKMAQHLGITISPSILLRADEVIE